MADGRRWTGALTTGALAAFASNSVLCRLALGTGAIDPATFTSIRVVSGAAALVLGGAWARRRWQSGGSWRSAWALATYAVAFSFAYVGLEAGIGALLLFGAVQATMIGVALRRGDHASSREWIGLVAALCGLVYLVAPGVSAPPLGASTLMAGAGIAWGIYSLHGRGAADPAANTTVNFVRAAPIALAVSAVAIVGGAPVVVSPRGATLALVSGALSSGLGYVVWYAALRGLGAIRAATVQLAVPVIAAAGGVALLGEAVTARLVIAATMILGGVALAVSGRSTARPVAR